MQGFPDHTIQPVSYICVYAHVHSLEPRLPPARESGGFEATSGHVSEGCVYYSWGGVSITSNSLIECNVP